jgi:hypothetical protein
MSSFALRPVESNYSDKYTSVRKAMALKRGSLAARFAGAPSYDCMLTQFVTSLIRQRLQILTKTYGDTKARA